MSTKKPSYDKIIQALLTEPNKTRACKLVGIARSTLARYESDPEFIKAYRTAIYDLMEQTTRKLQSETFSSVETLADIRDSEDAPINERRQAAKHILELSPRYTDQLDILTRLEALERSFDEEY